MTPWGEKESQSPSPFSQEPRKTGPLLLCLLMPQFPHQLKKKSCSFLVSLLWCPGTHREKDGKASTHAKEERTVCAHSGLASFSLKGGKTKTFVGAPFFKLSLVLSEVLVLKEGKKGGPQTGNHRLTPWPWFMAAWSIFAGQNQSFPFVSTF